MRTTAEKARERKRLPQGVFARLRAHRILVALGFCVAILCAAASVGSLSMSPPFFTKKPLAASTAHANIYVGGPSGLSSPKISVEEATTAGETLSDILTSPGLRRYIAEAAGVPFSQLAVDGPIANDLQRTQQEPTGEKRSNELLAEGDLYRITIDDDYASPVLDVSAQAPTPEAAAGLANGTAKGLNRYLTGLEVATGTPAADRLSVTQAEPATGDAPGHSGIMQVALLTFLFVLIVWCGLVWAGAGLREHLRVARQARKLASPSDVLQMEGPSRTRRPAPAPSNPQV